MTMIIQVQIIKLTGSKGKYCLHFIQKDKSLPMKMILKNRLKKCILTLHRNKNSHVFDSMSQLLKNKTNPLFKSVEARLKSTHQISLET